MTIQHGAKARDPEWLDLLKACDHPAKDAARANWFAIRDALTLGWTVAEVWANRSGLAARLARMDARKIARVTAKHAVLDDGVIVMRLTLPADNLIWDA